MTLREEADAIRNEADAYLFHEHLEENNEPVYFHEFADAAKRHGLEYLAEADLSDMLVSNFPPEVAQTLQRVATDIIRMEQYMDFVRNRHVPADPARACRARPSGAISMAGRSRACCCTSRSPARIGEARADTRRERNVSKPPTGRSTTLSTR